MSPSSIIRVSGKSRSSAHCAAIHPEAINNLDLSRPAHLLHLFMLNQSDHFRFYRQFLANAFNVSVRTTQYWINDLKQAGLVIRKNKKNTMDNSKGMYIVFEVAAEKMKTLCAELKKTANKKRSGYTKSQVDKGWLKSTSIEKICKSYELDQSDITFLETAFDDWWDTLKDDANIRPQSCYQWLEEAMKRRIHQNQRLARQLVASDNKSREIERKINTEASNIRNSYRSTSDHMNDIQWAVDDGTITEAEYYETSTLRKSGKL